MQGPRLISQAASIPRGNARIVPGQSVSGKLAGVARAARVDRQDRMDVAGARWGLEGSEAVVKLRLFRANEDLEPPWGFHVVNLPFERSPAVCPATITNSRKDDGSASGWAPIAKLHQTALAGGSSNDPG